MALRAAAIGSTGRGNYGHGLDSVFVDLEGIDFVAIADDNPKGLQQTADNLKIAKRFADYRTMLAEVKPDLVSIGPRWTDQRVEMVEAAAAAGAHIYIEKPLAASLADADRMLGACEEAGIQMAVAHQMRGLPTIQKALSDLRAGKYGRLLRMRARGKEDSRGGGEDLLVLGTHLLDLMTLFAGQPLWVSAKVLVGDRPVTKADARAPSEPVGVVAGDNLTATFGFADGVLGFFESRKNVAQSGKSPFGMLLECKQATVAIRQGEVYVYPAPCLLPETSLEWEKVWIEDWHFYPDHMPRPMADRFLRGNKILVRDLVEAIQQGHKPLSSGADARWALEMIQGVYQSHLADKPVSFPLTPREHPLNSTRFPSA